MLNIFNTQKEIYNPKELLQNNYNIMEMMREKPLLFSFDNFNLIVKPLQIKQSSYFLQSFSKLLLNYYSIMHKVEFLSTELYAQKSEMTKAIESISIMNNDKEYHIFIEEALPNFCAKFIEELKGNKYKKLSKRRAKKLLLQLTPDELLNIFFTIIVFNYSLVKKKTVNNLKKVGVDLMKEINQEVCSNSTNTTNPTYQLPKYSKEPYNKEQLKQILQQSKQKEN